MTFLTELHPIVAQLSPSDEQAPAVVARGQDVAVTAGAGAGKTRTLVARYLSLLVDGLPLRSIVAITFDPSRLVGSSPLSWTRTNIFLGADEACSLSISL